MTAKVLMVDVDGVLVNHPDPRGWAAHLERDLGVSREVLSARFFAPHFGDILLGRARLRDRLAPVLAEIAPDVTVDQLIAYWFANDAHVDEDLRRQLLDLRRRGLAIHLATLQEHERAAYLWDVVGLKECCDAMHYAAELGCAKPALEFFAAAGAKSGFSPTEILFIDDRPANVEASRACGWTAAVWTRGNLLSDLFPQLA